jgi:threonine dehydratase
MKVLSTIAMAASSSSSTSTTAAKLMATLPADIELAAQRISPHVWKTPLMHSPYLSGTNQVYLKLESEQVTGSFKARGSLNKILSLDLNEVSPSRPLTLVTSSTGNHAQGFARAVQILKQQHYNNNKARNANNADNIQGIIFMPTTANPSKIQAVRQCYPNVVTIEFFGQDCADTEHHALQYAQSSDDRVYIAPYNDPYIIAGQGTVGMEIYNTVPDVDVVFVCIGGGGLVSGVAAYLKCKNPNIRIVGCQPENSPEMFLSVKKGELVYLDDPQPTLSDGSAGGIEEGSVTFDLCRELVDEYVLVTEDEIAAAIRWMVDKHHKIVEGAAGVALAAFQKTESQYQDKKIAIVICGSNIGTDTLQSVLVAGMMKS